MTSPRDRERRLAARALRSAYRAERLPPVVLWSLAAQGMRDWMRGLDRPLRTAFGEADAGRAKGLSRELLADVAALMFRRRYADLQAMTMPPLSPPHRRAGYAG